MGRRYAKVAGYRIKVAYYKNNSCNRKNKKEAYTSYKRLKNPNTNSIHSLGLLSSPNSPIAQISFFFSHSLSPTAQLFFSSFTHPPPPLNLYLSSMEFTVVPNRRKREVVFPSWRNRCNKVTDQGNANSYFAFASVTAVEVMYFIKTGGKIFLSRQDVYNHLILDEGKEKIGTP